MDRIITEFKQRTLQIDFLEMSLVQNMEGEAAISYKGKGYIRQAEDDVLTFKLYATETKNTNLTADRDRLNETKSGEIYGEAAYYTLNAVASDGSTWSAEHILPECDWLGWHKNPVVYGSLSSCARGDRANEPRTLALHFFEKADIPCMINKIHFKAESCDFDVHKDDESFIVRAKSEKPLPAYFAVRVEEALRFLLAQSVSPRVLMQGGRLELFSGRPRSRHTGLGPPIARGSSAFLSQSWQLFGQYLGYVIRETPHPYWNPCTGYLHNALEASANSLDAWAIGLGVAVEGLAVFLPKKLAKDEKDELKALQKFIIDHVAVDPNYAKFTKRIQGTVNGLTSIRAFDRLNAFAKQGNTDGEHVEAWRKLRNRGVHPNLRGAIDVSSLDYQRLIDELHRVTVLMYHIVFHLIGYRGLYTDYATLNFPMKEYPAAAAALASAPEQPRNAPI